MVLLRDGDSFWLIATMKPLINPGSSGRTFVAYLLILMKRWLFSGTETEKLLFLMPSNPICACIRYEARFFFFFDNVKGEKMNMSIKNNSGGYILQTD